jgi:hypothetical protein
MEREVGSFLVLELAALRSLLLSVPRPGGLRKKNEAYLS